MIVAGVAGPAGGEVRGCCSRIGHAPGPAATCAARCCWAACWGWAANSPSWCSARRKARPAGCVATRPAGGDRGPVDGDHAAVADRCLAACCRMSRPRAGARLRRDAGRPSAGADRRLRPLRADRGAPADARRRCRSWRSSRTPEQVDFVRRFGNKIYYGDPTRPDLLRAAGAAHVRVFVVAVDGVDSNLQITRLMRRTVPGREGVCPRAQPAACVAADGPGREGVPRAVRHQPGDGREVLVALGVPPGAGR